MQSFSERNPHYNKNAGQVTELREIKWQMNGIFSQSDKETLSFNICCSVIEFYIYAQTMAKNIEHCFQ